MIKKTYNFLKTYYYKYYFFRNIPHVWRKDLVETRWRGVNFKFKLYDTEADSFYAPKFLNENLLTVHREMKGYILTRDIQEGDYVLDCGAYNGAFSVYACKKSGPRGLVICIEPDSKNAKILRENLILNGCNNFIIVNKGIWHKKEKLKFRGDGIGAKISPDGDVTIDADTISGIIKDLKINPKKIDFVKMDVEGAEINALLGAKDFFKGNNPHISIASYHILEGDKTSKRVEKILRDFGYAKVKTVFPYHLTTIGSKNV